MKKVSLVWLTFNAIKVLKEIPIRKNWRIQYRIECLLCWNKKNMMWYNIWRVKTCGCLTPPQLRWSTVCNKVSL